MVTVANAVCDAAFFGVFVVAILGACNVASTRTVAYTFLGAGATVAGGNMLTGCKLDSNKTIAGIFVTILGSLGRSNVLSAKGMSHWYLGAIAVGVLCVSCVATCAGIIGGLNHSIQNQHD